MTYRIGKSFTFDAAHSLPTLSPGHKCSCLHGHTYTVEILLSAIQLAPHASVVSLARVRLGPVVGGPAGVGSRRGRGASVLLFPRLRSRRVPLLVLVPGGEVG